MLGIGYSGQNRQKQDKKVRERIFPLFFVYNINKKNLNNECS